MNAAHSRALLGAWLLLPALTACQIDDADVPKFGGPCSSGCANGFRCDKDLDACVPEEEPTDGGFVEVDAGNPAVLTLTVEADGQAAGASVNVERDEEFTLRWSTQDVSGCSITAPVGNVNPNSNATLSLSAAGPKEFVLTCTGNGAEIASEPVTVNVDAVIDGDLIVTDNASLDAAIGITEITGNVVIEGASITSVGQLATLVTIGGDFRFINSAGIDALVLPALESIGGSLFVMEADTGLESVDAPELVTVGEDVRFEDAPALTSISLPKLAAIDRDLYLGAYDYPSFPDVFDENSCVGLFTARPLLSLESVDLGALVTIGRDFDVEDCTALRSLSLPSLTSIGGMLAVFKLGEFASGKSTLSMPALTTVSTVIISGNLNLGVIELGALEATVRLPAAEAQPYDAPLTENLPSPLFHIYRASSASYCSSFYYLSTGDMFIVWNGTDANEVIERLDLSRLNYLAGGLAWHATAEEAQTFDALESADYVRLEYGGATDSISFPALTTLRESGLRLYLLPSTSIRFPVLTSITGELWLNPGIQVTDFELAATTVESVDLDTATQAVVAGLALTSVTGDFEISSQYDASTFGDLSSLTSIGGDLDVYAPNLTDLTGFEGLVSIGGQLMLGGNIENTTGLENLTTVGSISCDYDALTSLSLPSLVTAGDGSYGIDCDSSSSFPGSLTEVLLPSLETLNGTLRLTYSPITVVDIGSLTTVAGLSIGGTQLTDLNAFCGLTATTEHLAVYDNPLLVDISGLQNLTSIGSFLYAVETQPEIRCQLATLVEQTGVVPEPGDIDFTLPASCALDDGVCP
jgi:hypothetical protein